MPASLNFCLAAARSAGVEVSFRCTSLSAMYLIPARLQQAMVSSTERVRVEYDARPTFRPWKSSPRFLATSCGSLMSALIVRVDARPAPASRIASRRWILFVKFIGTVLQLFDDITCYATFGFCNHPGLHTVFGRPGTVGLTAHPARCGGRVRCGVAQNPRFGRRRAARRS